jgi:hypothetical protein
MKRIYISSTYEDLKDYRHAVADVLRNCGYNVDAMEKYAARDDRPKAACEADASNCDIYIGIFAWKYGYVPPDSEGRSITELEYLAAGKAHKPRLIFLLADEAPWPSTLRDSEQHPDEGGRQIRNLRKRLKEETWPGFFKSPDELSKQVLISLFQAETTKQVENFSVLEEIKSVDYLGPSYLSNIQERFSHLRSVEFVAVRLGPTPWWNTRLHLTAALASDFAEIREFVLLETEGRFLAMTSPSELRRGLTRAQPKLEMVYLRSRELGRDVPGGSEIDSIVFNYPTAVAELFGQDETIVKQVVTPASVRELGIKQQAEVLDELAEPRRPLLTADIVRRNSPYVVLTRNGKLEGIVDRLELVSRIAINVLK